MDKLRDEGLYLPQDNELFNELLIESNKQIEKWGLQEHSLPEWMTIIAEEFGELAQATLNFHFGSTDFKEQVFKEAIQMATLCLKIAKMAGTPVVRK